MMISSLIAYAVLPGAGLSILSLVGNTGLVVQGVLGFLMIMSVVTWGIIGMKWSQLRRAQQESERFLGIFWESKRLDAINESAQRMNHSPVAYVFRAAYQELLRMPKSGPGRKPSLTPVNRTLRRASTSQTSLLESRLIFLATTASAAPFIGLFGTVWGIMNAFNAIGASGSPNIAVVAPHIAEALIATAVGLFAAIPAVMAYNYFSNRVRRLEESMDLFAADLLNILESYFASSHGDSEGFSKAFE